jgi:hypothetical protein
VSRNLCCPQDQQEGVWVGGGGGGEGVALVSAERPVGGRRTEGQGGSLIMLYSILRHDARIKRPEGDMDCLSQVSQVSACV